MISLPSPKPLQRRLLQDDVLLQVRGDGAEEALALEPLAREQAVGVAVGAVAEDGDDGVAGPEALGDLLGGDDVERAAGAEVDALLVEAAVHHLDALLVRDMQAAVEQAHVGRQVVRDAALADALGDAAAPPLRELPAGLDVRVQHRARRVREVAAHAAARGLLQIPRDARERAGRARGAREGVDGAGRLRPDLGARRLDVRAAVRRVVELVRPHRLRRVARLVPQALGVPPRLVVVVVRVVEGDGGHGVHRGAEEAQQVDLALRLRVGHVDDQLVPPRPAHVRQPDARVARRALHHRAPRPQQPPLLRVLDHVQRCAVLN